MVGPLPLLNLRKPELLLMVRELVVSDPFVWRMFPLVIVRFPFGCVIFPVLSMAKIVAEEEPMTNELLAPPATGLMAKVANGELVPMPKLPFDLITARVLEAAE